LTLVDTLVVLVLVIVYRILDIFSFWFWGVGRGVLRFWDARYRKPRSNLGSFSRFCAISVSGGVDIIYLGVFGMGTEYFRGWLFVRYRGWLFNLYLLNLLLCLNGLGIYVGLWWFIMFMCRLVSFINNMSFSICRWLCCFWWRRLVNSMV